MTKKHNQSKQLQVNIAEWILPYIYNYDNYINIECHLNCCLKIIFSTTFEFFPIYTLLEQNGFLHKIMNSLNTKTFSLDPTFAFLSWH